MTLNAPDSCSYHILMSFVIYNCMNRYTCIKYLFVYLLAEHSLFTDPLFSLQRPSSMRDKKHSGKQGTFIDCQHMGVVGENKKILDLIFLSCSISAR